MRIVDFDAGVELDKVVFDWKGVFDADAGLQMVSHLLCGAEASCS